jgi:hypothetical protein
MKKFNAGYTPQVVAIPIRKLTRRSLDRAIKKLARYFNVDNDLEHVSRFAEYHGYALGSNERFIFIVEEGSEFNDIAIENPEIWNLALLSEEDTDAVVMI